MGVNTQLIIEMLGTVLLFGLVFGMSATCDFNCLKAQVKNTKAIITGLALQFGVMPFLGFLMAKLMPFEHSTGLILLVITSSPGGSYSNWFCSLFNGDLALSVAMTAISTLMSTIMLPLNLFVYSRWAYHDDELMEALEWTSVFSALSVVIIGISSGLFAAAFFQSAKYHLWFNRIGNFSGLALVLFSAIMSNSTAEARFWNRQWHFYIGVGLPCVVGLLIANIVSTMTGLLRPECVSVSVECCIQNCGIAVSLSLSLFRGEKLAKALAVPFYYGIVECLVIFTYCWIAWRHGWTKAPTDISAWKMISTSYEVLEIKGTLDEKDEADDFCYVDQGDAVPPIDSKTDTDKKTENDNDSI